MPDSGFSDYGESELDGDERNAQCPFERLRFKKNPYCGSFGTSLTESWLTLDYRKDPGFKAGEAFPLRRTGWNMEAWLQKRFGKTTLL
jgi:hypothetical protein